MASTMVVINGAAVTAGFNRSLWANKGKATPKMFAHKEMI